MKKISFAAVFLLALLLASSCKGEKTTSQSQGQILSSEIVKTETSTYEVSSKITVSSEISKTESEQSLSQLLKPSTSSAVTSNKAPVSSKISAPTKPKPTLDELKAENSQKAQEIIQKVTNDNMTDIEKAKATYLWLYPNFKYRTSKVDLSKGYTEELTHKLANYFFKYRKGSCEHYAAVQKVLLEELGFECFYIRGERFSYWTKKWGDHTWLHVKYGEDMYHVDGLYGGLFYDVKETTFMVPDDSLKKTHRWNKDTYKPCTKPQILK